MINEFEFYHGIVFTSLLHRLEREFKVRRFTTPDNAAYVIDGRIGLYVKYSKKRLPPWRFSFHKRHQELMLEMKSRLGETFLMLVCNDDGVVVLNFDEVKQILKEAQDVEWISVVRRKREMYAVAGSDGKLDFKVGKNDFIRMFIHSAPGNVEASASTAAGGFALTKTASSG